jgi:bile acid:Na+ symporter, BASS family
MFRLNDVILLLVIFSSMIAGILLPRFGSVFQPYPLYLMMFLLFLSFLSIKIDTVLKTIRHNGRTVLWLSLLKLIILPTAVYFLFRIFYPSYAVAVLLLTGISTGVVAPFISSLVQANGALVLVIVVISSLMVPLTLPALVEFLLGQSIEISFPGMVRMLCLIVFVPILVVELLRRLIPALLESLMIWRFPVSLIIFAVINLGVFSKYAGFFQQNPLIIIEATLVAIILGGIYLLVGFLVSWKESVKNQLSFIICLGNVNNVLVIVFASEFFGPLEPTLSAMYMIPFFGLILPLRVYQRIKKH